MGATLYDMLLALLGNYYTNQEIFQAYQNNFVIPASGNYVIITELDTKSISYPAQNFVGTGLPSGTRNITNVDITTFQLDFYGTPARTAASGTRLYLQSNDGTSYLEADGGITVYEIGNMQNLTAILDQRQYLPRFTFTVSLFNNAAIHYTMYDFNTLHPSLIRQP